MVAEEEQEEMTQDNELTARQRGEREAVRRGWITPADTDCADDDSPRAKSSYRV